MVSARILTLWEDFGREQGATHVVIMRVRNQSDWNNSEYPVFVQPDESVDGIVRLYERAGEAVLTVTAWTWAPRPRPCGTSPSGHRRRGERVCDDCREYDRARKHPERNPT